MRCRSTSPVVAALAAALVVTTAGRLAGEGGLSVAPSTLQVGMFSSGGTLHVAGRVAAGSHVVVVVRGADTREEFRRKERVGIVWVAGGKLEVSNVPATFMAFSDEPVGRLVGRDVIDRFVLDERALLPRMEVTPAEADRPEIREAYLQLKTGEGSFRSEAGGVELGPPSGGQSPFTLELPWPRTARPGSYQVLAHECRDGAVVSTETASLEVRESGFAAGMKELADRRGGLYGLLAVAVTLSVGFGVDFGLAWVRRLRRGRQGRGAEPVPRHDMGVH